MELAQAKKIKTVYDLAAKNGRPLLEYLIQKGVRIDDGADAMNAFSEGYKFGVASFGSGSSNRRCCGRMHGSKRGSLRPVRHCYNG